MKHSKSQTEGWSAHGIERLIVEDDLLVIQITTEILSKTGDIRNVDFPEEGAEVEKGDEIASISGTDEDIILKAPISGTIIEINDLFIDNLLQNRSGTNHAEWIVKIEPQDPDDLFGFTE